MSDTPAQGTHDSPRQNPLHRDLLREQPSRNPAQSPAMQPSHLEPSIVPPLNLDPFNVQGRMQIPPFVGADDLHPKRAGGGARGGAGRGSMLVGPNDPIFGNGSGSVVRDVMSGSWDPRLQQPRYDPIGPRIEGSAAGE